MRPSPCQNQIGDSQGGGELWWRGGTWLGIAIVLLGFKALLHLWAGIPPGKSFKVAQIRIDFEGITRNLVCPMELYDQNLPIAYWANPEEDAP